MKYIWIVMLVILEIIWLIYVIKDIYDTSRIFRWRFVIENLDELTFTWIIFHIIIPLATLFIYSMGKFFNWW